MKFIKTLLAVAALGAAFTAQAESTLTTGAAGTALTATAKLNFRVIIPKVLFLRVGSGTDFATAATPVDNVVFTLNAADIGTSAVVAGVTSGTGIATGGAGSVAVRLVSTGGNVNLSAASLVAGPTAAGVSIPWTAFSSTSSNTLLAPVVGAPATSVAATSGVVNQSANWTFSYANTAVFAAGTYDGVVTYTASIL